MVETSVFNRTTTTDKEIGLNAYNLIIGLTLCWGFLVNWWMVSNISTESIQSVSPLVFFGGYFVSCFAGIWLFNNSDKPVVSFIGYNLVVIPFGFVLNIIVSAYDPELVVEAVKVTGLVTGVMMILGTLFPAFFRKISGALFVALIAVIIIELIQIFIFNVHPGFMDWIVALIFCGYIGVDWGRANQIPKTVDNAIDSAAALYIDIINLFVRILSIMGNND